MRNPLDHFQVKFECEMLRYVNYKLKIKIVSRKKKESKKFSKFIKFISSLFCQTTMRNKKKKIFLIFSIALVIVACKSKKGSWTSADKEKAQKEVEKYSSSLEILGKNKVTILKFSLLLPI